MKEITIAAAFSIALFATATSNAQTKGSTKQNSGGSPPSLQSQDAKADPLVTDARQAVRTARELIDRLKKTSTTFDVNVLKPADAALVQFDEANTKGDVNDALTVGGNDWREKLRDAAKNAKSAQNEALKEYRRLIFQPLEPNEKNAQDAVEAAASLIKFLSSNARFTLLRNTRSLPKSASEAQSSYENAREALTRYSKVKSGGQAVDFLKPEFRDSADFWADSIKARKDELQNVVNQANKAKGVINNVLKEVRAALIQELSSDGQKLDLKLQEASKLIKGLDDDVKLSEVGTANKLLGKARDSYKKADAERERYRKAVSNDDALDFWTSEHLDPVAVWAPLLATAFNQADDATKVAGEANKEMGRYHADKERRNNELNIELSKRENEADDALKSAAGQIDLLKTKALPDASSNFLKEAQKALAKSNAAFIEYKTAKLRAVLIDEENALRGKIQEVLNNAKAAQEQAREASGALKRYRWSQFWLWAIGCLGCGGLGAGIYFLFRGCQHLRFLRSERENFLCFSRERGLLRLEATSNSKGLIMDAPEAVQKKLGYTATELAAMKLEDLVVPESKAGLKTALENAVNSAKDLPPQRLTCCLRTKSGRAVQAEGVFSFQRRKGPKIVAILEDISWKEELVDAQARIETMGAYWTDGILVVNERQEVVVANDEFCRMFSVASSPEKIRGLPLQKLTESVASSLRNSTLLTAKLPASLTVQTGSGITIQAESTPVCVGNRDIGRVLCFRDKTSQLKADEKLLPLIEHFRSSVPNNSRFGIAVIGPDGRFLAVSEALCTFFGHSREEMLLLNEEKLTIPSNGEAALKPADGRVPARRSYRRKDGSVAAARVQVTDWPNEQGVALCSLMCLDDSGERQSPPKAASWVPKDASTAWCPESIAPHLPWLKTDFVYEDNYARKKDAGIAGWAFSGATHRGRLHAQHATHREDAFCWETGENFSIACVSDGAGSCRYSRIGSESVCREVTRLLREALDAAKPHFATADPTELINIVAGAMGKSVWHACIFLRDLANKARCDAKDFRCTLLLVVHYKSASGEKILGSQVGDGFVEALMRDGTTRRFGTADSGEFSGQVSCFIPDDNAVKKAGLIFQIPPDDLQALLLCSDGIEDAFFPIEKLAGSVFRQFYLGVQQKLAGFEDQKMHGPILGSTTDTAALQAWLDFEKRGENDDRTVLVLHRQPPQPNPPTIATESPNGSLQTTAD